MKADEEGHESSAIAMGAKELNPLAKKIMGKASKLMTKTTFYI
jgi:demethoxyubiquinone hydroxylase (CLK1/Coq7/Cat5 family)